MTSHRIRPLLATVLLLTAIPFLAGCGAVEGLLGGDDVPEGETDVFAIGVGDCLDDSGDTEVQSVPVVDCADPHDFEAYLAKDMEDGDYPGSDAVTAFGDETCAQAFEDFVGAAEDDTSLAWTYYSPLEDGWAGGDREILCLAGDSNGQVTGSIKGAGADYPLG